MRAIDLREDTLCWVEVDDPPQPGPGEVTLAVRATAVNRADLMQRAGLYPPPKGASPILGLEAAGTIAAVGEGVVGWSVGDRAMALLSGGGYAERVTCPAGHLLPVPPHLDDTDAAALPEVVATVVQSLLVEGALQPGERVLVHAGGSGVGTMAVQLCRAIGCPVWVTAGSDDKIARCVDLGAEGGANRHDERYVDLGRFDVILDPVGAAYLEDNLRALRTGGRLVVIGLLGGRKAPLDLGRLLVKRLRVVGTVLRSRSDEEKTHLMTRIRRDHLHQLDSGALGPVVHAVMDIADADAAHALLASNRTTGKIVLRVAK